MKLKRFLFSLLIFQFCVINAQSIERYFEKYNSNNGLNAGVIQSIYQDKESYIWLATNDGLVKYDGYVFNTFRHITNDTQSLSCNNITYIVELQDNKLLIGTYDCGLNIFDTKTEKVHRVKNKLKSNGEKFNNRVLSIYKDTLGKVWVGLNDGSLNIFDIQNNTLVDLNLKGLNSSKLFKSCHGFSKHFNNKNLMWIGTSSGLVLLNTKNLTFNIYKYTDNFPDEGNLFNRYRYPVQTDNDNVWMGSWGGGMFNYNIKTNTWTRYLINNDPPLNGGKNVVHCITVKSKTELWIATIDSGTGIFDIVSKKYNFINVDNQNTNIKNASYYIFTDLNQNLWSGCSNGLYFHAPKFAIFQKYKIPLNTVTNLKNFNHPFYYLEDKLNNGLWVASFHADGLSFYNYTSHKWQVFKHSKAPLLPRGMIFDKHHNILLLTAQKFEIFNTTNHHYTSIKLFDSIQLIKHHAYSLLKTKQNEIYIGTANFGIFKLSENYTFLNHYFHDKNNNNSIIENGPIYNLHEDINGNIWAGLESGASMLNPKNEKFTNFSFLKGNQYEAFKGNTNFVNTSDGKIYMSSIASGILCVDAKNNYKILKGININNGLISNIIYNILLINNSQLLVYTAKGIQIINPSNLKSYYYNTNNNYPFTPTEWGYSNIIGNNLYIGIHQFLIKTNIQNFKFPNAPKPAYLTQIKVFEKQIPLTSSVKNEINFNYKQNFIKLYFSNFEYFNTKDIRLNYIIKGLSKDTFYTEKGMNEIILTGLSPKNYELIVWYSFPESNICSEITKFNIKFKPPWWQTWWFFLIIFLILLLLIIYIHKYRLKQSQEKSNLKQQLSEMKNSALRSQMNPHFLFNSLNSVNYYIQNNEPHKASQYLKKFSKLVRMILNNSRKNTVTLEDELDALRLYLNLEELRFSNYFKWDIDVEQNICLSDIIIPPLLIQPFVENAIWHGIMQKENGGWVKINIVENSKSYVFTIEDNGIGRKKANELKSKTALEHKSHGMEITNERIRLFNATHLQQLDVEIIDIEHNKIPTGTKIIINYKP